MASLAKLHNRSKRPNVEGECDLNSDCGHRVPPKAQRRQLTQQQQTHILSDIQKHQHRFNVHQNQRSPNVFIQPSIQLPVPPQSHARQPFNGPQQHFQQPNPHFHHHSNNLHPPTNGFRAGPSSSGRPGPPPLPSFGAQVNRYYYQHHTQTTFIPNFLQLLQQDTRLPPQQRSVQNQLGGQFFNGPPPPPPPPQQPSAPLAPQHGPTPHNNQPSFLNSIDTSFGGPQQRPPPSNTLQSSFPSQNPSFPTGNQVRFPSQGVQQPVQQQQQLFPGQQLPLQAAPQNFKQGQTSFGQVPQPTFSNSAPLPQFPPLTGNFQQSALQQPQLQLPKIQQSVPFVQSGPSFNNGGFPQAQAQVQTFNAPSLPKTAVPTQVRSREVLPSERTIFEKAVKMHTKPVAEPTAATSAPTQLSVIPLKPNAKKDYSSITQSDLDVLLSANRQSLFQTIKSETAKPAKAKPTKVKSTKALGRDELLKQLKLALAETSPSDLGGKNYSSTDLVLPNGEKVQVIRTTDPEIIKRANANSEGVLTQQLDSPTTPKPLSFEDIARSGLLPPGADFELIKQTEDGQIQEVGKIPPQKKVTFVYLEEQDDGSYKVQGVKGSGDKETKTSGADVDSILKRIKNGEIQLPPPSVAVKSASGQPELVDAPITTTTPRHQPIKKTNSVTIIPHSTPHEDQQASTAFLQHTATPAQPSTIYASTAAPSSPSVVTAFSPGAYSGSTLPQHTTARLLSTVAPYIASDSTARYSEASSIYTTAATPSPATPAPPSTEKYFADTTSGEQQQTASSYHHPSSHQPRTGSFNDVVPTASASETVAQQQQDRKASQTPQDTQQDAQNELPAILKSNGLFAMAKYLRQSGLDTILNETGPYTIFVPTDKAFRSLLVQLGGPEKAEEKFRNNPRLLSGLLLHHVIPGSFEIASLQDEMTGVSLAGTQLRVNQYNMHDSEWNDVKVTTINGAMVVPDKQDIVIPQGVAHAVDRVMFPLPVGDILQTLQSDRERRFTHFLRALFASGMSDTLQNKGIKTYTVFAPTDAAFAHLTTEELTNLVTEKEQAEELVRKHVVPGTLFTAGMRFYQVKDVMAEGKTVTLQKTGGKIKVNDGYLQTSNIPTTNGVIHAIDSLL
ncbi:AGAP010168-PA-like protein [Anopheles sinensis]|uniref:AGAP010168-PA-like protein n=1 Tax=Anopheles sinensis TaxID=74873 RepID=A0A084VPZ5_ANOSI|nr:AGAP010168-PA-like protein [Anopheles sinensis]